MRTYQVKLLTCFLIFCIIELKSQNETATVSPQNSSQNSIQNPNNSSAIGAFLALPMGEFGKTDIEKGGFAKQGYGFAFDSKNVLGNGFSFVSHSTYAWVDIDGEAMAKAFDEEFGAGYRTEITNGQHQPFLSTIGLNYDYYVTKRLSFGLNAQAGILYNSFRPMGIKVYYTPNNVLLYDDIVSYESNFAFAYGFGVDMSFSLIPNVLSFQITADYSAGNLNTYLISKQFDPIKSVDKMQFLNLGAGLVFYSKK